mmetsp:Transcript_24485/g.57446  ORF Transcript_24485/g.57446 Transcript_24485/m.57446 type:complete len:97 (+) Transcript_24485:1-291(+)
MMGKFGALVGDQSMEFTCSDNGTVRVSLEHDEGRETIQPGVTYEVIGQAVGENGIASFVHREMSADMDLGLYNKMSDIQHDKKFKDYFGDYAPTMQ